jgi:hypothetical protein
VGFRSARPRVRSGRVGIRSERAGLRSEHGYARSGRSVVLSDAPSSVKALQGTFEIVEGHSKRRGCARSGRAGIRSAGVCVRSERIGVRSGGRGFKTDAFEMSGEGERQKSGASGGSKGGAGVRSGRGCRRSKWVVADWRTVTWRDVCEGSGAGPGGSR